MNPHHENMDRLIQGIEKIPTIPVVGQKVMEVAGSEDALFKDLVHIIEKDQALASTILRIANSSFYGFLSRVTSLGHALVVLGIDEVRSIALGFAVHNFFTGGDNETFDRERFWTHAVICSQVSRFLGKRLNIKNDGSFFLSGLIHDIGKIVFDQYFHDEFVQIVEHVSMGRTSFTKAEKEIVGTTHCAIAGQLLTQWSFPRDVVAQITHHHNPWHEKDNGAGASIIYLADVLTKLAGYPSHPDEKEVDLTEFVNSSEFGFIRSKGFGLNYEKMRELIGEIQELVVIEADNVMRLFRS